MSNYKGNFFLLPGVGLGKFAQCSKNNFSLTLATHRKVFEWLTAKILVLQHFCPEREKGFWKTSTQPHPTPHNPTPPPTLIFHPLPINKRPIPKIQKAFCKYLFLF